MGRPGKKEFRLAQHESIYSEISHNISARTYYELEDQYRRETEMVHRKRFGQYFTPSPIAKLMCNWIMEVAPERILDPAVGVGAFISEIVSRESHAHITAVDIDPQVLKYANRLPTFSTVNFVEGDFLHADIGEAYDAIVANPPYLKHHDFSYEDDVFCKIGMRNNIRISKLTNIYALFILEICRRLRPGGRAAIVVPTEWTNANFGQSIKHFLLDHGLLQVFLYFSHEALPFSDALTTACVLFIEKPITSNRPKEIKTIYINKEVDVDDVWNCVNSGIANVPGLTIKGIAPSTLLHAKKWDYLLQHEALPSVPGLVPLRLIAKTRRGIATGANEFFHVSQEFAVKMGIQVDHLLPCVGKASNVSGLIFDRKDFKSLIDSGRRTHLINILANPNELELAYLEEGKRRGLSERYLLAARKKWYEMEKRPVAPIWAAVFGRSGLRFIRNSAGISNLTTFHCIYPVDEREVFCNALSVCLNSSFIKERARRQHRVYGGGLLKVEPKDLLEIEVPNLAALPDLELEKLAAFLFELDAAFRVGVELPGSLHERINVAVMSATKIAANLCVQDDLFQRVTV